MLANRLLDWAGQQSLTRNLSYGYAICPTEVAAKPRTNARAWAKTRARVRRLSRLAPRRPQAHKLTRASVLRASAYDADVSPPNATQRKVVEAMIRSTYGAVPRRSDIAFDPVALGPR